MRHGRLAKQRCCGALVALALLSSRGNNPARAGEEVGHSLKLSTEAGAREHWFWLSEILLHRAGLFDADRGRLVGSIASGSVGVGFAIYPHRSTDGHEIYIAESYFSRGVRGSRSDVVSVYDGSTLDFVTEIPIPPKRAEYMTGVASSALSDNGRWLAVFNVAPAQSVTLVDVAARSFVAEVETPGCSLVYPAGPERFFLLCGNGGAMLLSRSGPDASWTAKRTAPFFDPDKDPISEKGARLGESWLFVSFEGQMHTIDVSGDELRFEPTWPLFDDADRSENWRIGGQQVLAVHPGSGRLFALVHQGGPDTHKDAGSEIWVFDLKSHARLAQIEVGNPIASFLRDQARLGSETFGERAASWALETLLPNPGADGILVTPDNQPRLIVAAMIPPAVMVHDALTGERLGDVAGPGVALGLLAKP